MHNIVKITKPIGILFLIFFSIPFGGRLLSVEIILLVISTLFFSTKKNWRKKFNQGKYFHYPLIVFFILHLIGLLWSSNIQNGVNQLEHKLSFLIFPIIIPFLGLKRKQILKLFQFFSLSCLIVTLYCFLDFLYVSLTTEEYIILGEKVEGNRPGTVYEYLSQHFIRVNVHRTYFSAYLIASVLFVIFFFNQYITLGSKRYNWFGYISIFLLLAAILLIQSKAAWLIIMLFIFFGLLSKKIRSTNLFYPLIIITICILFFTKKIAYNRIEKLISEVAYIMTPESDDKKRYTKVLQPGSTEVRYMLYKSSLQLIYERPFFGYGTGDVKDVLKTQNEKNKFISIAHLNYGPHSQFLFTLLGLGILGLFGLLNLFFIPIYMGFINREYFITFVVFTLLLVSISESFLVRQDGIIPTALFLSVLPYLSITTNNQFKV